MDQGLLQQAAGLLLEASQLAALLADQLHLPLVGGALAFEVDHLLGTEPLAQGPIQLLAGAHRPEEGIGLLLAGLTQLLHPLFLDLAASNPLHLHWHITLHQLAAAEVEGSLEALDASAQGGAWHRLPDQLQGLSQQPIALWN